MNKATKILIIQFVSFAFVFLLARYLIAHFELLAGIWIPIASGLIAIVLVPQLKVFKIDGKETVYVSWLFSKAKPVDWL